MGNLELSETEIKLIVDGLEMLPNSSEFQRSPFVGLLQILDYGETPEEKKKKEQIEKIEAEKMRAKRDALIEDIRILQGKLISYKRNQAEQNALNQTNKIINNAE